MTPSDEIASIENVESNNDSLLNAMKKKPMNFRTEMLKGVHSPSDVLSPFSQKISSERNSALKNFKPKSLMDRLLGVKSQLGDRVEEQLTSVKAPQVITEPEVENENVSEPESEQENVLEQEEHEDNEN